MTDPMTVAVVCSIIEAQILEGMLREAGIPARVSSDDCGGARPEMQLSLGAQVYVPASRLAEARRLIASPTELTDGEDVSDAKGPQ